MLSATIPFLVQFNMRQKNIENRNYYDKTIRRNLKLLKSVKISELENDIYIFDYDIQKQTF